MNMKKIWKMLFVACALGMLMLTGRAEAEAAVRVEDMAGVLETSEISSIKEQLEEVSSKNGVDIGLCIAGSLEDTGRSSAQAAADYFNESWFGTECNSVVLFIALGTGSGDGLWQFSTTGSAIETLYDNAQLNIWADMQDDVRSGNYVAAFTAYAEGLNKYLVSSPNYGLTGILAVVVGAIAGLIRGGSLKSELKSVAVSTTASNCVKAGSFNLTRSGDVFLYRTVERTKRDTSDSSSSTHVSDSGTEHGGIGGSF